MHYFGARRLSTYAHLSLLTVQGAEEGADLSSAPEEQAVEKAAAAAEGDATEPSAQEADAPPAAE